LGFVRPPLMYWTALFILIAAYLLLVQLVKQWFVKKYGID